MSLSDIDGPSQILFDIPCILPCIVWLTLPSLHAGLQGSRLDPCDIRLAMARAMGAQTLHVHDHLQAAYYSFKTENRCEPYISQSKN